MKLTRADWWELGPLLGGILAGWAWLIRHGGAFSMQGTMWGYGWPEYILESWLAAHGDFKKIDDLRTAVYSGAVGHLGEALGSYAQAGVLVSSLSAAAVVVAAGIGARALSTGWAGGVAALAAGIALAYQEVPTTINQYPMLAAACGLALALALVCARWPRAGWAGGAGLMAGLAWAVETRGLIIIPPVMVLVSLGIWRGRSTDRRRMALVAIAAMAMGLGLREVLVQKQLQEWEHTEEYREELIDRQRRVVHRWIGSSPVLSQGICGQVPQDALLSMDFLTGPCPRQLIQDNFTRQLPPHLALGFGLTLLSALLTLLPGRRGRAASVDSAVLVFGAGAGLLFVAGLTPMPRRYIFQWTALLAMIGASGPSRLAETLGGTQRRWLQPLVASALLGWMLLGGIKGQATPTIAPLGQHYQRYVDAQQSVLQHLQPGDGLMDCSANYVELSLLPRRTQPDHPTREPRSDYCQKWIEAPSSVSGQAWVLIKTPTVGQISGESGTEQPRPGSMKGVDLRENIAVAGTWEKVLQDDLWELWRHGD